MAAAAPQPSGVRVAVEGCGHGTLNAIYASVETSCKARGWDGVDLLIIGGDFQATRNAADLTVMSVPAKYRELGDFHEYYSGARTAPYLTIFVAGNHEASSYLWELYYGGWVAPNIYYLGAANVLRLGPLRIAGMSGIWKGRDYRQPHHERLPFSADDIKTFYHVRELDVRKLLLLRTQVDVGISHDWPRAIERHGDQRWLFRRKPDFEAESAAGTLGNPAAEYVMDRLRPPFWFSAHLHCKFSAIKTYGPQTDAPSNGTAAHGSLTSVAAPQPAPKAANPDEIDLDEDGDDDDDEDQDGPSDKQNSQAAAQDTAEAVDGREVNKTDVSEDLRAQLPESFNKQRVKPRTLGQPVPPGITNTTVRFLALDKCLPGRKFLQLCEIQPIDPAAESAAAPAASDGARYKLQYDPEWLAISRVFAKYLVIGDKSAQTQPDLGEESYVPLIDEERAWVDKHIVQKGKLDVPENFTITAPPHPPGGPERTDDQPDEYTNPQTQYFCSLLDVKNLWDASPEERQERKATGPPPSEYNPSRGGGFGGRGRGRGGRRGGGGRGRGRGANRGRGWAGAGMRP